MARHLRWLVPGLIVVLSAVLVVIKLWTSEKPTAMILIQEDADGNVSLGLYLENRDEIGRWDQTSQVVFPGEIASTAVKSDGLDWHRLTAKGDGDHLEILIARVDESTIRLRIDSTLATRMRIAFWPEIVIHQSTTGEKWEGEKIPPGTHDLTVRRASE